MRHEEEHAPGPHRTPYVAVDLGLSLATHLFLLPSNHPSCAYRSLTRQILRLSSPGGSVPAATMFSRGSSTPPIDLDDAHLEVTVTPSASAFYAGETFSAVITLRNTRIPPHLRSLDGTVQPSSRPHPTHLLPLQKRSPSSAAKPASPDTPTFSPDGKWRGEHARRPSGMGHQRRSQSLALDKSVSSQEMIWALGGGDRSGEWDLQH